MLPSDRQYQTVLKNQVRSSWAAGKRWPMLVLPTGGGKTVIFSTMVAQEGVPTCLIAHRQELVEQISLAVAGTGLSHKIVGPRPVIRRVIKAHTKKFKRSFYDPRSNVAVAGVDTLVRLNPANDPWFSQVKLVVQDEAHHVLRDNKWGKAAQMFPNAKGLLVTATPERADGKGLGAHAAGIADDLIVGPTMQELIDASYLTPFRIYGIPANIKDEALKRGNDGDYTKPSMIKALEGSGIVGDVVVHYKRLAMGKRGVTFVTDVKTAEVTAETFRKAGVPAVALSADTPDDERAQAVADLVAGKILQIVNVDLLGEGFDCPGIEVVSFARMTESYAVYAQQFGRALRILEGKTHAIIIDHVGNVIRHGGPPTQYREWSLSGRTGSKRNSDAIPLKYCSNPVCCSPYERYHTACPWCGYIEPKRERSSIEQLDGDLVELDPNTLNALIAQKQATNQPLEARRDELVAGGMDFKHINNALKSQRETLHAQKQLQDLMAVWSGNAQYKRNIDRRASQKLFYLRFGIDVLNAQALKHQDANKLIERITGDLWTC